MFSDDFPQEKTLLFVFYPHSIVEKKINCLQTNLKHYEDLPAK